MNKETIDILQLKIEDVINLLKTIVIESQELDKTKDYLSKLELEAKEHAAELKDKEEGIYIKENEIIEEKAFIIQSQKELAKQNLEVEKNKRYLEDIKKSEIEWEMTKQEAILEEARISKKTKDLQVAYEKQIKEKLAFTEEINKRERDLEQREEVIQKSNTVDAERKRLLDVREKRIRNHEARLQIEQEE